MAIFDGMDPWDRLITMQARIEQLESINTEIVKHVQLTSRHLDSLNKAVSKLQLENLEIMHNQLKSK